MPAILGYWAIRGLAQPIRLLLEYAGVKYEDKLYVCGDAPDFDRSCWFDVKFTLGLAFPNLPYYIDGDTKISQSMTILKHLSRTHNLEGQTEKERIRADLAKDQAKDLYGAFVGLCYNPNFESLKEKFSDNLPPQIKAFDDFLGDNKWFAGDNITYADFILYEMLDQLTIFKADVLKGSSNLQRFHKQFEELEPIQKYMASDRYSKAPLNNKSAKFGNK